MKSLIEMWGRKEAIGLTCGMPIRKPWMLSPNEGGKARWAFCLIPGVAAVGSLESYVDVISNLKNKEKQKSSTKEPKRTENTPCRSNCVRHDAHAIQTISKRDYAPPESSQR